MVDMVEMSLEDIIKKTKTTTGGRNNRSRKSKSSTSQSQNQKKKQPPIFTSSQQNKKGPTKLQINNLQYGVTAKDIGDLLSNFGKMKTTQIHYNQAGKSLGSGHAVFVHRSGAVNAMRQYNGIELDGRAMRMTIEGDSGAPTTGGAGGRKRNKNKQGGVKRLQGTPKAVDKKQEKNRKGRNKKEAKGPPPTLEDLDKEMDVYKAASVKKDE